MTEQTEVQIERRDESLAQEFAAIAELLQRSTVHVRTPRLGAGSGVIWRSDGLIVTNAHVARGRDVEIELSDGKTFAGETVLRDEARDLAAVRIDVSDLPAAAIMNSLDLRVGQLVLAVGNPLGLIGAMTMGVVHAIAPVLPEGGRVRRGRDAWVQADIELSPGNSGGPLADARGQVVGINSMVAGGLGLAVPSDAVRRFLGAATRPQLGVSLQPVQVAVGAEQIWGLLILETTEGGAAARAGLIVGDVLTGFDGQRIRSSRDLPAAIDAAGADGVLKLDVTRGGQTLALHVSLSEATVAEPSAGVAA